MYRSLRPRSLAATIAIALSLPASLSLAAGAETTLPTIEVTTSKIPEPVDSTPAMITVVTGEELRARNVQDLRQALSLVAGVDIAPGGDAGPAGSVPGMWGLREFDAFLLVVDGIPSGGAFNPALTTLDLTNVERIEVLRGPAPVMYGATSFVGVIQIIHYAAGATPSEAQVGLGSRNSGIATISSNLPDWGVFKQSLSMNAETHDYSQDDSGMSKVHLLYRNAAETDAGKLHFDLDATALRQDPYSPHPREGDGLSPRFPLDANVNPSDAKQNTDRIQFNAGFDHRLAFGDWITTFSLDHSKSDNIRGFLREDFAEDGETHNADGFSQRVNITGAYFDTYIASHPTNELTWTYGFDWLYGDGQQNSDNFEYGVFPNGSNRPNSGTIEIDESTQLKDTRNFLGLYTQLDWKPTERWNIVAGLRFNHTEEELSGQVIDQHAEPGTPPEGESSKRTESKPSGVVGASYALWLDGPNRVTAFADYRNTYKPAAVDFGPEAEGGILQPETAHSWEAGLKGQLGDGRFDWELSYFDMDFNNLVIAENIDGLPGLANAGSERFKGAEIEGDYRFTQDFRVRATYAYHDARFTDYARLRPDDSIQQLAGKRLELSPQNLGAVGLLYTPVRGLNAELVWNYVGSRYLNKGNTVVAGSYTTVDAGIGYRFDKWELRVDGYNITNRRDPVAESELGDAQFYRLSGDTVLVTARVAF